MVPGQDVPARPVIAPGKSKASRAPAAEIERLLSLLRDLGRLKSLRDPVGGSIAETYGLTHPQVHAVLWLDDEHPMAMGVLARRLGITEKTVTGIVDRLEEAGIAQRDRASADRRIVRLTLTPLGRERAKVFVARIHEKAGWLLSLLDGADRIALFRILEKVRDRMAGPKQGRLATEAR